METISLSNVELIDTMTVAADGRLYVGRDLADREFKVVLVDEGAES